MARDSRFITVRRGRIATLAALFLLAAAVARLLLGHWVVDPDTFFHIVSGRWIVDHRAIPTTDVLSWYGATRATRWLAHEWLFDVSVYAIWKTLGFQGVFAATALVSAGAVLATRRLAELRGATWITSVVVAMVAIAGIARAVTPRPGVVTFLLLPLIAVLLERDRWLPALALFVLGMNFHGGAYPIYLLVVLYYATRKRPWLFLAACTLVLAQPLGFAVLKYPFFTLTPLAGYIRELQPTLLGSDYLLLAVIAATWLLLDRRKVGLRDLVAAVLLLALSLKAIRTQPYFYLLALPLLSPAFSLPRRPAAEKPAPAENPLASLNDGLLASGGPRRWDLVLLGGLIVGLLAVASQIPRGPIDVDRGYPAGAVDYVKANGITRVWNEWNDGGYLLYRGVPTLVDGRLDPFDPYFNPGTTLAVEYMRSYRRDNDIRPLLRKYGVTHLIVHRSTGLYQVLAQSRDFRERYSDSTASVFEFVPSE